MKKSQLMLKIQNGIEVFENPIFGQIRMVMVDDEPMFCLVDVCRALEMSNPTMVAQRLDEDERTKLDLGRSGETNFITESGLYAVILRSDKPNAKKFRKWVTSDVLPSIRKHGAYATKDTIDKIISNPDYGITLLQNLKEERNEKKPKEEMRFLAM